VLPYRTIVASFSGTMAGNWPPKPQQSTDPFDYIGNGIYPVLALARSSEGANLMMRCFLIATIVFFVADVATSADLLTPSTVAPLDQLSNIRKDGDDFGSPAIAIDYNRTRQGSLTVALAGKTKNGPITIMSVGIPTNKNSGTIRLANVFSRGNAFKDIEFYMMAYETWAEGI
jgi:hypothetical protein